MQAQPAGSSRLQLGEKSIEEVYCPLPTSASLSLFIKFSVVVHSRRIPTRSLLGTVGGGNSHRFPQAQLEKRALSCNRGTYSAFSG